MIKEKRQASLVSPRVLVKEKICVNCLSILIDGKCETCGKTSLICEVCKIGFSFQETISACPECKFQFHFNHFRATVLIFGVCPVCRVRVKHDSLEIFLLEKQTVEQQSGEQVTLLIQWKLDDI